MSCEEQSDCTEGKTEEREGQKLLPERQRINGGSHQQSTAIIEHQCAIVLPLRMINFMHNLTKIWEVGVTHKNLCAGPTNVLKRPNPQYTVLRANASPPPSLPLNKLLGSFLICLCPKGSRCPFQILLTLCDPANGSGPGGYLLMTHYRHFSHLHFGWKDGFYKKESLKCIRGPKGEEAQKIIRKLVVKT